jgi:prefoldin alpha subunit
MDPILAEYTQLRGYAETIRQQLEMASGVLTEFALSKATLDEIKKRGGEGETLIHIGAGNYVRTSLHDVKTVVVGIGAGVSVEKPIDDAMTEIDQRMKSAQEQIMSMQSQYNQVVGKMGQLQGRIDQMYSQLQASGQV